ncbi:MAG: sulfatase-like hydrolase/transferase, partial [Verrucomicrobiota bacterium]|nr:sulfatase-like hydrolase/transferase [Verrucomicrobiota bacterium]
AFIDQARDKRFFLYVPFTIPHADFVVPELEDYTRDKSWSEGAKTFASMITRMDRDCGRILARLKHHGIEQNTLVLFTSDNGGLKNFDREFDNNRELKGFKGDLTEGGLRVPCIASWPGRIKAGSTAAEPLAFWDFMPTFAELAGVAPPAPVDGISFVPTLTGKGRQQSHPYLFFNWRNKSYIIRGKNETRGDKEIIAEARTEVVIPEFVRNPANR